MRFPVVPTLEEALAPCDRAVGFTARIRQHREVFDLAALAPQIREWRAEGRRVALVFGNEQDGLTTAETAPLSHLVCIPTAKEQRSLNLGSAVAVALSALYVPESPIRRTRKRHPLEHAERAELQAHVARALLPLLRGESARLDLQRSIERLFASADLEARDARAWRKLARRLLGEGNGSTSAHD